MLIKNSCGLAIIDLNRFAVLSSFHFLKVKRIAIPFLYTYALYSYFIYIWTTVVSRFFEYKIHNMLACFLTTSISNSNPYLNSTCLSRNYDAFPEIRYSGPNLDGPLSVSKFLGSTEMFRLIHKLRWRPLINPKIFIMTLE